jgi:Zn-dependent protease/CBS domain-containing protein
MRSLKNSRGFFTFFSIKGVTVYLHWTMLLLAGWALIANSFTGMKMDQVLWTLAFLAAMVGSLLLHEAAHALVGGLFGINAHHLILLPVGGVASVERLPGSPLQELAVSIAGPLMNVLLAAVLALFIPMEQPYWAIKTYTGIITADNFIYSLFIFNLLLAAVNLIPAFPMDGGRLLRAVLGTSMNYIKATSTAATISKVIAWALVGIALLTFNAFLLMIGLFLLLFAGTEAYYFHINTLVKGVKVSDVLMYEYNQLPATLTVAEAVNVLISNFSKYFIAMDGGMPVGIINRMEIIKAVAEKKYGATVGELMKENLKFYDSHTPVEKIMHELASHPERIYPVVSNGYFAGVISFQHIIEYLLLQKGSTYEYDKMRSLAELV